ncbi:MAG: ABC transporter permease [Oscillospiraceae bacterium]|jgi:D-methionine transport system permease protein|nr:ABC transporter permease [Oscillospiraceae bacterium]
MREFWSEYGALLLEGTVDTLAMTIIPTLFAYVLGLPLGVILVLTKRDGLLPARHFNSVFGALINILRSLPFMILMIFVIPFTRLIAGTSIGSTASMVPLVIAAAPFIARMVETSLEEVDANIIEAARCMGANNLQIVVRVILKESVPSLLRGLSISIITILGYTAVTGAMGAGGLGNIAYRYGYQRYQLDVMYVTILLLLVIVCVVQGVCSLLARQLDKRNR